MAGKTQNLENKPRLALRTFSKFMWVIRFEIKVCEGLNSLWDRGETTDQAFSFWEVFTQQWDVYKMMMMNKTIYTIIYEHVNV